MYILSFNECVCVSYSNPTVPVFLQFSSLHVMMQLFRINTAFKLLELLSFKGIFMRRKKSLSLIWFKYFQPQQKLNSQKLIRNAESFLVGEKLSRQNAVLLQLRAHEVPDQPILPFPRSFRRLFSVIPPRCVILCNRSYCLVLFVLFLYQNLLLFDLNSVAET